MCKVPRFLKAVARPIFNMVVRPVVVEVKKRRLKRKLLDGLNSARSEYAFTKEDIEIHISERFVRLPKVMAKITDDADLVNATINGKSIFWPASLPDKDLPWLYHEIFDPFNTNPSSYDHPDLNYENRKWIIDAGAAEGYFSIFALEKSPGSVLSVEPLSLMKMALMKTLASYANGGKAIVVSAALGDKPGWSEIKVDYDHICDSKLPSLTGKIEPTEMNSVTERVPVTTIDQLAIQYSLGMGGLIKMDIEGYEMAALSGAVSTLKECKPALAIAVYHEFENARKCAEIIKAANPTYKIEFRGYYGYFDPPRPYIVFAY